MQTQTPARLQTLLVSIADGDSGGVMPQTHPAPGAARNVSIADGDSGGVMLSNQIVN